jgi:CHAT domain-containing protein
MAEEAMLLNLEGTRLVALLGCDTGRGVEAGEGVQGFRHALSVAGARSTLLTLWEVGDLSIARFLREFMIRSSPASRMTVDEALAETQLAFLRGEIQEPNALPGASRWRHPYFWAAATLGGEDGLLDLELRK